MIDRDTHTNCVSLRQLLAFTFKQIYSFAETATPTGTKKSQYASSVIEITDWPKRTHTDTTN